MKTPRIRLVTRGDDAGSCRSANLAIRDCCVRGILRNTSVLARAPAVNRDWQRRMFMDPANVQCCAQQGITPIRYVDLPARRRTFLAKETAR